MRGYDWLILASVLMLIGANMATNFVITKNTTGIQQVGAAQAYVLAAEQNPVMPWALQFGKIGFLLHLILIPAVVYGLFWYYKKSEKFNRPEILWGSASTLFLMALSDLANDLSIVLGIIARGG